jgi:hypothetical protein
LNVILNGPFKLGMKAAFREYVHQDFNKWVAQNPDKPVNQWSPKLTMGVLKPHMPGFVTTALQGLTVPEFKETIRNAFATTGHFDEMRSEARQAAVAAAAQLKEELNDQLHDHLNIVPDGEQLEVEPIQLIAAADHQSDDSSEDSEEASDGDDSETD